MPKYDFCSCCCQHGKLFSNSSQDFCDDCLAQELDKLDNFLRGMFGKGLSKEAHALYLANSNLTKGKDLLGE